MTINGNITDPPFDFRFTVVRNQPPEVPQNFNLLLSSVDKIRKGIYINDSTPFLSAQFKDPDLPEKGKIDFKLFKFQDDADIYEKVYCDPCERKGIKCSGNSICNELGTGCICQDPTEFYVNGECVSSEYSCNPPENLAEGSWEWNDSGFVTLDPDNIDLLKLTSKYSESVCTDACCYKCIEYFDCNIDENNPTQCKACEPIPIEKKCPLPHDSDNNLLTEYTYLWGPSGDSISQVWDLRLGDFSPPLPQSTYSETPEIETKDCVYNCNVDAGYFWNDPKKRCEKLSYCTLYPYLMLYLDFECGVIKNVCNPTDVIVNKKVDSGQGVKIEGDIERGQVGVFDLRSWLDLGNLAKYNNLEDLTIIVWIKSKNNNNSIQRIVNKGWTNDDGWNGFNFGLRPGVDQFMYDGPFILHTHRCSDATSHCNYTIDESFDTFNKWHFYAGVFDFKYVDANNKKVGDILLYVNDLSPQTWTDKILTNSIDPLTIGTSVRGDGALKDPFLGKLDNVMIFNRVLSQEEINAIYRGTSLSERSVLCKHPEGTDKNAIVWGDQGNRINQQFDPYSKMYNPNFVASYYDAESENGFCAYTCAPNYDLIDNRCLPVNYNLIVDVDFEDGQLKKDKLYYNAYSSFKPQIITDPKEPTNKVVSWSLGPLVDDTPDGAYDPENEYPGNYIPTSGFRLRIQDILLSESGYYKVEFRYLIEEGKYIWIDGGFGGSRSGWYRDTGDEDFHRFIANAGWQKVSLMANITQDPVDIKRITIVWEDGAANFLRPGTDKDGNIIEPRIYSPNHSGIIYLDDIKLFKID